MIIITGSNTGLGKEAARALAARGAEVIIAVRDTAKGKAAAADIRAKHPAAKLTVQELDLSSLKSVKMFAEQYSKSGKLCHVLIANAGEPLLDAQQITSSSTSCDSTAHTSGRKCI